MHTENKFYKICIFLFLLTLLLWLSIFPLKSSFDTGDVAVEGLYLFCALLSLLIIYKLDDARLVAGWFLFVYGLFVDFLDEFTHEPDFLSVYFEAFLTASGLLIIASGFYYHLREWEQTNEQLRYEISFKETLLDVMRHDLLNLANVVKGYSDLLSKTNPDPDTTRYLDKIRKGNDAQIKMIKDISELARLESVTAITFQEMDLSLILKEALNESAFLYHERNIQIINELEGAYPVHANNILKQAFVNILSNAAKYSPEGSSVRIYAEDVDAYWRINIADSGPGIADEDKVHIFKRFSRAHKGSTSGSGIGLAIVWHIILLHKGSVNVHDNPAGGSIFSLEIPKVNSEF
ncbi:MAG: integral membrane sensor signal transduction histidine kinase [Methanohalophilus sp. T328-1]|jgi:signal transduction histidine kinase|nr:MAG: integral membrane sensor signal transduction histidine kinase [Methanohalophilus sp. T328-1]OBZ35429.1 MAG: hypothetical protein A9957_07095 [Methanohalophilus sp. DAL1]